MNSSQFHQAWGEEIAGWRMQEAAVEDWHFHRHSEIFTMIAKISQ